MKRSFIFILFPALLLGSVLLSVIACSTDDDETDNGIIRVDYIISPEGKINMLEINTTPGMTVTSFIPQQVRAAGLEMKDVLTDIVENQF